MKSYDEIKFWADPLLQGLTFWLGYSKVYYHKSLLKEGAITAEAVKIIHSKLKDDYVECEIMYKKILSPSGWGNKRADIVIYDSKKNPKYIIEVKRHNTPNKKIDEDLERLSKVIETNNEIRTFLLLVSESKLPNKYVTDSGVAVRKIFNIGDNNSYKVRRVCKASSSFNKKKNAHFAGLIEVFTNDKN